MNKIVSVLLLAVILLFISGCSAVDEEYNTVFKEDFKNMETQTPFQEATKKYLEKMYENNQAFKAQLDTSGFSFDEFADTKQFKDVNKLVSLKEATQSQKEYFEKYWTEYFTIMDEWEAEGKALNEGDTPQFTEEFYKSFKRDFNDHYDAMLYMQYLGDEYFDLQIGFIDFMIANNANFFVQESDIVFYDTTLTDTCYADFLKVEGMKELFFKKFEKEQDSWEKNLKISNDFGKYTEFKLNCYPASGLTAEENYKRQKSIKLDISLKVDIRKMELQRFVREAR